jgi:putative transcriptional regulator
VLKNKSFQIKELKNRLKIERAIKNLTQDDLSKLIGVSRQTINSIETGRYIPSTVLSLKISKIFDKPVNEIFELDDSD